MQHSTKLHLHHAQQLCIHSSVQPDVQGGAGGWSATSDQVLVAALTAAPRSVGAGRARARGQSYVAPAASAATCRHATGSTSTCDAGPRVCSEGRAACTAPALGCSAGAACLRPKPFSMGPQHDPLLGALVC